MAEPVKRNKVGEADPATRRRMLEEALRPGPPVKSAAAPPSPKKQSYMDSELEEAETGRRAAARAKALRQ